MSKYLSAKAIHKWAEEKPTQRENDEAKNAILDGDPDYEEIVNTARRQLGGEKSISDALQSHHASQPERIKLEATWV